MIRILWGDRLKQYEQRLVDLERMVSLFEDDFDNIARRLHDTREEVNDVDKKVDGFVLLLKKAWGADVEK